MGIEIVVSLMLVLYLENFKKRLEVLESRLEQLIDRVEDEVL